MTFSIKTPSIVCFFRHLTKLTVSINDTQHNNSLPLCGVLLCGVCCLIYCYAECLYAECHNVKYRYAECCYAECHGDVFRFY
jgi:hypothetical protein